MASDTKNATLIVIVIVVVIASVVILLGVAIRVMGVIIVAVDDRHTTSPRDTRDSEGVCASVCAPP